eukprot:COSAG04_NODE_3452_length_2804_cov_3.164880_1_plen_147_part_00
MAKAALDVRLLEAEWAWLTESAAARSLPDEGKAFRCCVNYLAQSGATVVAGAEALVAGEGAPHGLPLAPSQLEWVTAQSAERGVEAAAFGRAVVQTCMGSGDDDAIFGVIRCKTGTAATVAAVADADTKCEGAQEALKAQAGGGAS